MQYSAERNLMRGLFSPRLLFLSTLVKGENETGVFTYTFNYERKPRLRSLAIYWVKIASPGLLPTSRIASIATNEGYSYI